MLSKERKLKHPELAHYQHTGPCGHSEPVGWKLKDTPTQQPEYEPEPKV